MHYSLVWFARAATGTGVFWERRISYDSAVQQWVFREENQYVSKIVIRIMSESFIERLKEESLNTLIRKWQKKMRGKVTYKN